MGCYRIGGINIKIDGLRGSDVNARMRPYETTAENADALIVCCESSPMKPYMGNLIDISITSQEFLDCGDKYVLQFRGGQSIYAAIEFDKSFRGALCRVCDISQYNGDSIEIRLFKMAGIAYRYIASYHGLYTFHASSVVCQNKAVLFLAPAGVGKSTNANLWIKNYPKNTYILNDDAPVISCKNGVYSVHGTPWCGKDGLNSNKSAEAGAFVFIKRATAPAINRMSADEARIGMITNMRGIEFPGIKCAAYGAAENMASKIASYTHEFCMTDKSARLAHDTIFAHI